MEKIKNFCIILFSKIMYIGLKIARKNGGNILRKICI